MAASSGGSGCLPWVVIFILLVFGCRGCCNASAHAAPTHTHNSSNGTSL